MKLISTNKDLEETLSRLIDSYHNIAFAVAWASADTYVFKLLINNKYRIRKSVIGIHFYQTHPDVLDAFLNSKSVRFLLQPTGVFHPKIYLFWSEDPLNWEALVGSANLTAGALNINSEVVLLVSSSDEGSKPLFKKMKLLIEKYWAAAEQINRDRASRYRLTWERQQDPLRRLSGQYGKTDPPKSPLDSSVMSMSWNEFYQEVRRDVNHMYKGRCEFLQFVRSQFTRHRSFASMDDDVRRTIAGLRNELNDKWGWFGSMTGNGYFYQAVNQNNTHLAMALDIIPMQGPVIRSNYYNYISELKNAFPVNRLGIAVASRLLSMKRPDYFLCVNSQNRRELCKDIGIRQTDMSYERYWEELVQRILDSPWWNSPRPRTKQQRSVWEGRAAMLDAIFYRPPS